MSKLAEVAYDIEQLYIEGLTEKNIAKTLDIPEEMVYEWIESVGVNADEEFSPHATMNS